MYTMGQIHTWATVTSVRTTAIAVYEERKTPNIADANGIPNAG